MYKIVIDSCGELPEELKQDGHYETVSLELEVDGCRIKDDSTFNQLDFLRRVKESLKGPKSSCPSPEQYMEYIQSMNTYFVLETLETLRKNGRLSNLKAFIANSLNIKPVMGSTKEGLICQLGQARGMNKALERMVKDMISKTKDCENRILAISHCNCPERAKAVKEKIEKIAKFKKIIIINTAGVSSMYANDGGVIMAV